MQYDPQTILEQRRLPAVQSLMRPAHVVMTPERLGAMRQSRLSFVRPLIERAARERWQIQRLRLDLDEHGRGVALYRIETPDGSRYHTALFSEARDHPTDRAYEVNWDIIVWLVEGDVTEAGIAAAHREASRLVRGTGRADPSVLAWTRANRSARLVEHSVSQLAAGRQPDLERVAEVGYLARNVYFTANGMNGTRMFAELAPGGPLSGVYQVQMLGLYLIREFSFDLVDELARQRASSAVQLDPAIKRYLGVGNASGVGLNYVVTNHPSLMARWIEQRELALALLKMEGAGHLPRVVEQIDRYRSYLAEDTVGNQGMLASKSRILEELECVRERLSARSETGGAKDGQGRFPWREICEFTERELHLETQEIIHSLLLEAHPALCDAMATFSMVSEATDVDYEMTIATLRDLLHTTYGWAFEPDTEVPEANYWNWYRSQDGDEPRVAPLSAEHVDARYNIALDMPGLLQGLDKNLSEHASTQMVAEFLIFHPELRDLVGRIQSVATLPYAFVRMNMKHEDFSPLPLTRFVLQAVKGMEKTTLYSDRWVRGTFLQGAPIAADISGGCASLDWVYPVCPRVS